MKKHTIFPLLKTSKPAVGPSYSKGTGGLFSRVKWPEHEMDHSFLCSSKVKSVAIRLHLYRSLWLAKGQLLAVCLSFMMGKCCVRVG